jgi:hypothetical protein
MILFSPNARHFSAAMFPRKTLRRVVKKVQTKITLAKIQHAAKEKPRTEIRGF